MKKSLITIILCTVAMGVGYAVLDLRGLTAGVYLYTIRCGQYVENGKIVIAK